MDIVVQKLELSGVWCYIGYNCNNSFMYADDIILLSISVTDLQLMFNLCAGVFTDLDLPINTSKCHCMRIGPRSHANCSTLSIEGVNVQWVVSIKFLGVTLCQSKTFKCLWDDAKSKFYSSSNAIIGKLNTSAPESVILKLINSQGVPCLLYGIAATTSNDHEVESLICL